MNRLLICVALLFAAAHAHAAGVWYGSTSDLSATVSSTPHDYPTILAGWVKFSSVDDDAVLSLSDGEAAGNNDSLQLRISGASASAVATANGTSSSSSQSGLSANQWQFVVARFDSTSSRQVRIGSNAWSTASVTPRTVGNFDELSIGSHHTNSVTGSFAGRIAGATIIRGIDPALLELAVNQLAAGLAGNRLWHSQSEVYLWQYLRGAANDAGYSIGPTLTPTNLTFDSEHPVLKTGWINLTGHLSTSYSGPIAAFRWLETAGDVVPEHRLVVMDSDEKIDLAGASEANWIGVAQAGTIFLPSQRVLLRGSGEVLDIESVGGATWVPGTTIAYAAESGLVDDNGTIAVGLFTHDNGDGTVRVLLY